MANVSRIHRELMQFNKDQSILGMSLMPDDQDIRHLTATIPGPISTPYEGGIFHLDITLPDGYPFEPPKMRFTTKVWHPNISSQTGAICLDILKNNWSPALNLKTALISLQALLSAPEPKDPQDAVVARQYIGDYATYVATARRWTEDFAKASSAGFGGKRNNTVAHDTVFPTLNPSLVRCESFSYDLQVQKLVEMGFPEALVKKTLEAVGGDENMALERLCPK